MALLRMLLLAVAAAVAACASVPAASPPSYYVVRHLQKAEGQDPPLTEMGRRNAEILADLLRQDPPSAIYVSSTRRARETAEPAARRYGVAISQYDPRDTPGLLARVRSEPGSVLIVGHSNTVPAIVEGLGGGSIGEIGESDYGTLYHIQGPGRLTRRPVACIPLGDRRC